MTDAVSPNPYAMLAKAATGDLTAQRDLVRYGLMVAYEPDDDGEAPDALPTLIEASMAARLAASHGHMQDEENLIAVLCAIATEYRKGGCSSHAEVTEGEVAARLDRLADAGHEGAGADFQKLAGMMTQAGLQHCRDYQELWEEYGYVGG